MHRPQTATDRVIAAAAALGLDIEVRTFPEGTRTSADAAAAIGCDVAAIAKSLVLHDDDGAVLVLASGAHRVDVAKVGAALGTQGVRRATAEEVREATSYAIGGTAPFGHPAPLRTLVDVDLHRHDVVWAAGGTPDTVFPITPAALQSATGGIAADVAEVQGG